MPGRLHIVATSGCNCFHEPSSSLFNATLQTSHAYKTHYGTNVQIMPVAEARTSPKIQVSNHMDILTALIMQSSPSWSPSPLPLFSSLSYGDDSSTNTSPERLPRLPIRKRPRIYDLRHYQSTPFVPSQSASTPTSGLRQEAPPQYSPVRGRRQRQCVNADSPNRARNWFASPDRFLSSRSPPSPESPVQLGRAVPTLRPRERYTRRRDDSINPFRSDSSLSPRSVATPRLINPTHRVSPPRYTPSFAHVTDALPRETGIGAPRIAPRQISAGAVWNVGGQATAQITSPRAADGQGGLHSSGTHAPLHIAHFLDHDTPDQDLRRHEDRVALALGVDPATRILLNIRTEPPLIPDDSADVRSYNWRNNAWTWGDFQKCKPRIYSHRKRGQADHSANQSWTLFTWPPSLTHMVRGDRPGYRC